MTKVFYTDEVETHALSGIHMHDSAWDGEYYFLEQPVHRLNPKQRAELHKQHIGFVFQSYHLLDNLTVYENIDLPLSYRDVKKAEREGMCLDTKAALPRPWPLAHRSWLSF